MSKNAITGIVIVAIVVLIIGGGYWYTKMNVSNTGERGNSNDSPKQEQKSDEQKTAEQDMRNSHKMENGIMMPGDMPMKMENGDMKMKNGDMKMENGDRVSTDATASLSDVLSVTENAEIGKFLVGKNGMTLYIYAPDEKSGESVCYGSCAKAWPPYTVSSADVLDELGVQVDASAAGYTIRKDGSIQATYDGWPLYLWVRDHKPGDVTGQGVGEVWFVLAP